MTKQELTIGQQCFIKENENSKWFLHKIIKLEPVIMVRDIDPNDEWQGLEFELYEDDLNNKTYFKLKP
jgi:hypothetical protein